MIYVPKRSLFAAITNIMYLLRSTASSSLSLPSGSYIYSLAGCSSPPLTSLAAISSDDSLRLFDARSLELVSIAAAQTHEKGVTSLTEYGGDVKLLATGGRDGNVKLWDIRSGHASGRAALEMQTAKNVPVLSLACCADTNTVVAGTELVSSQATVVFWDTRSPSEPSLQYIDSHNDDVTELQFHQTRNNILLSGSTDGLVNIYDRTITDDDDAVLQVINHGSIHHAGFLSEQAIYVLSHDESFSVHPATNPDMAEAPSPIHFNDLRQPLDCQYVAQIVNSGQGAYLAAGNTTERRLDLVPLVANPTWQFNMSNIWRLAGAHGDEIVRALYFDEQSEVIFTCGEDSLVQAWKPADSVGSQVPQETPSRKTSTKTKTSPSKDKKRYREEKRYAPY